MIEAWGRGTIKIVDECKKAGLPEPKFCEEFFWGGSVSFRNEKVGEKLGDRLGETEKKILTLVKSDSCISIPAIAMAIGVSTTAVENNLKKLKDKGIIKRIGSPRRGHWLIISEGQ